MAKKEVVVCDLCGKVRDHLEHSVSFDDMKYVEICESCYKKINSLFNRIKNPSKTYQRKKAVVTESK